MSETISGSVAISGLDWLASAAFGALPLPCELHKGKMADNEDDTSQYIREVSKVAISRTASTQHSQGLDGKSKVPSFEALQHCSDTAAVVVSNTTESPSSMSAASSSSDVSKRKRPQNAFWVYSQKRRVELLGHRTGLPSSEIFKLTAKEWKNMNQSEKEPYFVESCALMTSNQESTGMTGSKRKRNATIEDIGTGQSNSQSQEPSLMLQTAVTQSGSHLPHAESHLQPVLNTTFQPTPPNSLCPSPLEHKAVYLPPPHPAVGSVCSGPPAASYWTHSAPTSNIGFHYSDTRPIAVMHPGSAAISRHPTDSPHLPLHMGPYPYGAMRPSQQYPVYMPPPMYSHPPMPQRHYVNAVHSPFYGYPPPFSAQPDQLDFQYAHIPPPVSLPRRPSVEQPAVTIPNTQQTSTEVPAETVPKFDILAPRKRGRALKEPGAPKHPMSSFFYFLADVRPKYTAKYPGCLIGPISKMISADWKSLTEENREKYVKLAKEDKKRYSREIEVWIRKKASSQCI